MASMNKPAANDSAWYQPVTDNWTSVETNLLDKSAFAAKGDLLAASGASSPTRLPVGSTGQLLTADSAQSSGVKWATATDMSDALLLKSFFSAQSMLPSKVLMENLYTWPAADFYNLNGGTLGVAGGRARFTPNGTSANFGWSLGASYSKVLMILGGLRPRNWNAGVFVCNTLPVANDLTDGYLFLNDTNLLAATINKANGGGSYTQLTSDVHVVTSNAYSVPTFSLAAYIDGSTNRLVMCSRMGPEVWMTIFDITDTSLATFRYAGIFISNQSGNVQWLVSPLAIYVQ